MMQNEKREQIQALIDEKINPVLESHMGGMEMRDYQDGVLTVRFTGTCGGCYAAEDTLENVVKEVFRREMPEIREVLLDNSVDEDMMAFARSLMRGGGR
ncbi:NifU family protein [Hornefia butyriciproducens]|nr:NifU family protein [Hornefia butyriciproducens]MCI7412285.1 NifU family protein [Clostridiales bacterium]MCI7679498.1 NifU family protein [Clostridiales bacterium]MDD6299209.1 NifU family protein [Hornefia butyriciproducens]MDY5424386.1 NifU family protein [Hornefia butyriciproducens]MDY5463166.1 NifU family protein [Hornefia butyriciproducens]